MDGDYHHLQSTERLGQKRIAVVDIGSNSVRLVVYGGHGRARLAIFNEKTACGLGADVARDGRLSERGLGCVSAALERFAHIARSLDAVVIDAFATAAAREAANGQELVDRVRALCGVEVEILSGTEEGRLSAEGVLSSMPGADGAMGDLGGGSLELVGLDDGAVGACDTLPVGTLRLVGDHGDDLAAQRKVARKAIRSLDWLPQVRGRSFVAVGGAWRALARVYMNVTAAPIHIVQGLTLDRRVLRKFLAEAAAGAYQSNDAVIGLSRRRVEMMPVAAMLLSEVIDRAEPSRVLFSAYGVREGRLLRHLSPAERESDPLLAACTEVFADTPRFHIEADEVFRWMSPLFVGEPDTQSRLRRAVCMVGDIGWRDHPDYRPEQVFRRLLTMPVVSIDHPGRAFLATAVYARYTQHFDTPCLEPARRLLAPADFQVALVVGGALRLAYEMSGGSPDIFRQTSLELTADAVVLHVDEAVSPLIGNAVQRRLAQLAKRMALTAELQVSAVATAA